MQKRKIRKKNCKIVLLCYDIDWRNEERKDWIKTMNKKPTVLMILDGYGLNSKQEGNAVALAKTPAMDKLMAECPFVKGNASGMAVGLPEGQMGNSEVGHLNMGAGRIVYQELTRITKSIQDGDFFENEALLKAVKNVKDNGSDLHFMGLLSDGGVHSHNTHLYGLLELAKRNGIENVYVHVFLDGRDTAPNSGKGFVEELQAKMDEMGVGSPIHLPAPRLSQPHPANALPFIAARMGK